MNYRESIGLEEDNRSYFFDVPLRDVHGIGCAALSLMCHGNENGVFCNRHKKMIDLNHERAIQISITHRSVKALSDEFVYSLVYFQNKLADHVWNRYFRWHDHLLKKLTRRVTLQDEPGLEPHRLRHFYIKSNHPIYIARYGHTVAREDSVPVEYRRKLHDDFEGFLMRWPKGYDIESNFFKQLDLVVDERRDRLVVSGAAPDIVTYVLNGESHGESWVPTEPQ